MRRTRRAAPWIALTVVVAMVMLGMAGAIAGAF